MPRAIAGCAAEVTVRCGRSLGLALLLVALSAVCARATQQADNLLFVSFDTTRADRLSAYGYRSPTSPAVAALAARGVLFGHAYSHVPSTLPAHITMMTGLLPPVHGVRCNGKYRLPDSAVTLAETLRSAGYATGAVVGGFPLARRFGLAQGFESWDDDFATAAESPEQGASSAGAGFWIGHDYVEFERSAAEVTDRALGWLARQDGGDWFLFAHYFDPHWPYAPPQPWAERFSDPYDGEIAAADYHLGRLLAAVAAMPGRTLVVFTADHGEGLGEHGEPYHNRFLFDSTLHVPLIVALDGYARSGLRIDAQIGHVDLMPTLLDLLGLDSTPAGQGRSFAAAIGGVGPVPLHEPLYAETLVAACERTIGAELRALLDGPLKLVRSVTPPSGPSLSLYDRARDPGETHDRAGDRPQLTEVLDRRLDQLGAERWERGLESESLEFDEGTKARLRSLGYL